MKTIMLGKDIKKKMLVICCFMGSWFMNCASTPAEGIENNDKNLNNEFPGEIYIDKRQRFSIVIPKGLEIKDLKIKSEENELDSLFFIGLMTEYNVDANGSLVYVNTSIPISEFVDEAFIEVKQLCLLIQEPKRENIVITTTDLQIDQRGKVYIGTTYLHGEYIKILRCRENDKKIFWQKVYYIPHRIGNAIMMITCSALLPDDNVDLDIVFDKFIKTFNWIR